jgi:hypothetical protein
MNRRLLIGLGIIALLIVVTACGAAVSKEQAASATPAPEAEPTMAPAEPTFDQAIVDENGSSFARESNEHPGLVSEVGRMVIHETQLMIIVEDVEQSMPQILHMVQQMEGYIVYSNSYRTYTDRLAASITLRVPAERLEEALRQIRAMAWKITQEQRSGQDVTDEYVDQQSRLNTLQATEQELLALLGEVRQSEGNAEEKASAILSIYDQLTVIRGQIEQIQGRMQYLEQMSAMATISVELLPREPEVEQPVIEEGFNPGRVFREGARTLVSILQSIAYGIIWFVTAVLPILAIVGLLLGLPTWLFVRRRRRRRAQEN